MRKKLFLAFSLILVGCQGNVLDENVPDISGVYSLDGCPKLILDGSTIHINDMKYAYKVVNIKGYNFIQIDGSLVYHKNGMRCDISHEDYQRYLNLIPNQGFFNIEMFSDSLNTKDYFVRQRDSIPPG